MRAEAPALLPILRSQHQAELLTVLLLHPDSEYTITELSQRLSIPLTSAQREVKAYDAARQACTALLAQQGLRPTTSGGHYAVEE